MAMHISDELKKQLSLLIDRENITVTEICQSAIRLLSDACQTSQPQQIVKTKKTETETTTEAMLFLFCQSCKANISDDRFTNLICTFGFSDSAAQIVTKFWSENKPQIRKSLSNTAVKLPHYQDLSWRMDMLVGSRTLSNIAEPVITMQLLLKDGEGAISQGNIAPNVANAGHHSVLLQTDPNNLQHMTSVLEEALHEAHTPSFRKLQRSAK